MHVIFECAARWELFSERRNPIEMVRVKDSTKRRKRPMILTKESFDAVLANLPEPYRTMVVVAQCLGLRVSEISALQWSDLDTEQRQLLVQRSIVNGRVDDVKTEYSHDHVPIHDSLLEVLLAWSERCPETDEGWMFPNPLSNKPLLRYRNSEALSETCGDQVGIGADRLAHVPPHVSLVAG